MCHQRHLVSLHHLDKPNNEHGNCRNVLVVRHYLATKLAHFSFCLHRCRQKQHQSKQPMQCNR